MSDEHPKVYAIMGSTGEYSDRREWLVAVYVDKEKAVKHEFEATKRAKEILDWINDENENKDNIDGDRYYAWNVGEVTAPPQMKSIYDPYLNMQSGGTDYVVLEVPLLQNIPRDKLFDPLEQAYAAAKKNIENLRKGIKWIAQTVHQAYHEEGTFETCTKSVCKYAVDLIEGRVEP